MENFAIQLDNVSYGYHPKNLVLHNVNLKVPIGSIYGFIGPNGSGKSTVMGLITDLIPNDVNHVYLFHKIADDYLPQGFHEVGSLIESPALYYHLSGEQNLKYICKIRGISFDTIDEILDKVGILKAKKRKVRTYSLGMKQRLAIAIALLSKPKLLLLDEPVNGLDPQGIIQIRELLVKLNQEEGITIFISSHLLDEIEKMCTHLGIIKDGHIIFEGLKEDLNLNITQGNVMVKTPDASQYENRLEEAGLQNFTLYSNEILFPVTGKEDIPKLVSKLTEIGIPVYGVTQTDTLETQFIQLTQNPSND